MKKLLALMLAAALAFSLVACGKSEAAKTVDEQISAIGEVTLDSESQIATAERAVAALEEADKEQLDNLDDLTQARATYDALVLEAQANEVETVISAIGTVTLDSGDAIDTAEKAYAAADPEAQALVENAAALEEARATYDALVLEAQANEVEAVISAIGTVTLDSGDAIDTAEKAYAAADPEAQALVENAAALEEAKTALSGLRVANVEELVAAIGEVTADSADAIDAARSAYDALSGDDKAKVSNADALETAEAAYKAAKLAAAESLLANTWQQVDAVQGVTFYYPANIPHNNQYWYYDQRCFLLPYLVRRDGSNSMDMWIIYCYTGSSWVFFDDITVVADGERFTDHFNYFDVSRDNGGGRVGETAQTSVSYGGSYYKMLRAISESKETIVRFEGDDHYHDITISQADKNSIKNILDIFDAFQGL